MLGAEPDLTELIVPVNEVKLTPSTGVPESLLLTPVPVNGTAGANGSPAVFSSGTVPVNVAVALSALSKVNEAPTLNTP